MKDSTVIIVRSGKGGDGHVSFRREKYVPNGGPDGGDGGDGGRVIFRIDKGLNTLSGFNYKKRYSATDGEEGKKKRCHGRNGNDIILKVPRGTIIYDDNTGKIIKDMSNVDEDFILLEGGKGGLGNMHFATSRMQTPKFAKPGEPSMELTIRLELKLIADVGLVGFPNAGKSTFLSRVSNARPKIADYPFTTLKPNLGVVSTGDKSFVIADIPGLIKGASKGMGLGIEFLKHIERTGILVHIVDVSLNNLDEIIAGIEDIHGELKQYSDKLLDRVKVILLNKTDALSKDDTDKLVESVKAKYPDKDVRPISAVTGDGVREITYYLTKLLEDTQNEVRVFESEMTITKSDMKKDSFVIEEGVENGVRCFTITGPTIDKVLGYTNLESEKGFSFFQRFIKESGIEAELKARGIEDEDIVSVGGIDFEYLS